MYNTLKLLTPARNVVNVFLLQFLFFYLVFKPIELIDGNLYAPIYLFSLFAGFWACNEIYKKQFPKIGYFLVAVLLSLSTLGVLSGGEDYFDYRMIFLWPAWFCVFSLSFYLTVHNNLAERLEGFFKIIIMFQVVISLVQIFAPDTFDSIWSSIKTSGIDDDKIRVTGSLYHPNYFALVITIVTSGILSEKGPYKNIYWLFLGYTLIIFSGSRTFVIGFPLIIMAWYYLADNSSLLERVFKSKVLLLISYIYAFILVTIFHDSLSYVAQLWNIQSHLGFNLDDSLHSINSLATREQIWYQNLSEFFRGDMIEIIIGKHNVTSIDAHNSFIHILLRYGLVGFFLYLGILMIMLSVGITLRQHYEGRFLYLVCLAFICFGLTDRTAATMTNAIFLATIAGIAFSKMVYGKSDHSYGVDSH